MPRFFNTAGPNRPERHYTLPVMARLPDVRGLIDQELYLSWRRRAAAWLPPELLPPPWPDAPPGSRLSAALSVWAEAAPRPLVVFLDEVDALQDSALISALRQIRAGYPTRPRHFPWSLALLGLRDVRDYKVSSESRGRLGTASPFNIKAESLTMRNFTHDEVAELYGQHTAETGQVFLAEAVNRAFHLIFDRRPGAPPLPERLSAAPARTPGGRQVTLIRA